MPRTWSRDPLDASQLKVQDGTMANSALVVVSWLVVVTEAKVGDLTSYRHGVKGSVYILDDYWLAIKDFYYDGASPDAFFYVGTELPVGASTGIVVPYPSGKLTGLEKTQGSDVVLELPGDLKTGDLKWLSVWCKEFSVNFGDVKFTPSDVHENSAPLTHMGAKPIMMAAIIFSTVF